MPTLSQVNGALGMAIRSKILCGNLRFLVPVLTERNVTVDLTFICCIHNPVRASKVNGVDVEALWYDSSYENEALKDAWVSIPGHLVLRTINKLHEMERKAQAPGESSPAAEGESDG